MQSRTMTCKTLTSSLIHSLSPHSPPPLHPPSPPPLPLPRSHTAAEGPRRGKEQGSARAPRGRAGRPSLATLQAQDAVRNIIAHICIQSCIIITAWWVFFEWLHCLWIRSIATPIHYIEFCGLNFHGTRQKSVKTKKISPIENYPLYGT